MAEVRLVDITKSFGDVKVIHSVNAAIRDGSSYTFGTWGPAYSPR